ncbi:MAG: DUF1573 domain-containing protein [Bacteroidetes bacterium]|nr:MAG: DUF1573 domain-containing protein [Bacteroidota bacterium]
MKGIWILLVLFVWSSGFLYGQKVLPLTKSKHLKKYIRVDQMNQEIGQILKGAQQQVRYTLVNHSRFDLQIEAIKTDCACTDAGVWKALLKPGERTELTISYDAYKPGEFKRAVFVHTNFHEVPLILHFSGEVIDPDR